MQNTRTHYYKGSPEDIGISIGQLLGDRLLKNINNMLSTLEQSKGINYEKLEAESMKWLETLPSDYQKELAGISKGSGCSIERIAQCYYSSECTGRGCTSFISIIDGEAWVGRNNDYIYTKSWGHVNILASDDKIPTMIFGMEEDIFSGTGFNKEKIWLHYNWLPVWDKPTLNSKPLPPYVFIRLALETCKTIGDIEHLIKNTVRSGGMNLFAVDGKNNEFAIYECSCLTYAKRNIFGQASTAGANHYCCLELPEGFRREAANSVKRQECLEKQLAQIQAPELPGSFISALSDPDVEQNSKLSGTVYSNICCPSKEDIWYTYGGFPAASNGNWEKVSWIWQG